MHLVLTLAAGSTLQPQAVWLRCIACKATLLRTSKFTVFRAGPQVAGYAAIEDVAGETYMSALGLTPGRAVLDVAVLCGFYGGFVLLALALTWASLACRGRPRQRIQRQQRGKGGRTNGSSERRPEKSL